MARRRFFYFDLAFVPEMLLITDTDKISLEHCDGGFHELRVSLNFGGCKF